MPPRYNAPSLSWLFLLAADCSLTSCSRVDKGAWLNYPFLTQKERDNETGLDYFLARYYSSTQGRFTSTDPIMITADRLADPQQINLYHYARNNPLRFIDPTGEDIVLTGSEAKQKEGLDRLRKQLGEERLNLVDWGQQDIAGLGTVTVFSFGSEENRRKFEAIGGNDAYELEFSQGMADIIGSKEHVEYQVAENFQMRSCIGPICQTATKATDSMQFGGAATVNKDESLTGNVQIFVSRNAPLAAHYAMEAKRRLGIIISSDGDALTFTPEQIDAHEFGHAHNVIKWGMRAEPSYRANRWENIIRRRQRSSNTRLVH